MKSMKSLFQRHFPWNQIFGTICSRRDSEDEILVFELSFEGLVKEQNFSEGEKPFHRNS